MAKADDNLIILNNLLSNKFSEPFLPRIEIQIKYFVFLYLKESLSRFNRCMDHFLKNVAIPRSDIQHLLFLKVSAKRNQAFSLVRILV